jgi:hypothetical protein
MQAGNQTNQTSEGATMSDVSVTPFSFDSTEIEFTANTEKGKALFAAMFGDGAVSVRLPKSRGFDFERYIAQRGLTLA